MKKVFFFGMALFVLAFIGVSFAGQARENTGCGLGTVLWKGKADNSTISQAFQATTNGIFGTQTFGITTGTLECKEPSNFVKNEPLKEFVHANMDSLAKQISMGSGETLDTLAELMEIPQEKRQNFYVRLKAGFTRIFPSEGVEMSHVIDTIAEIYIEG